MERNEDPFYITEKNMQDYRMSISQRSEHGGTRNRYIRIAIALIGWFKDTNFVRVDPHALDGFNYFFAESRVNPTPLTKDDVNRLLNSLSKMGETCPRLYLIEVITRILLMTDIRVGSLITVQIDDIVFKEDGTCSMDILSKTSNPDRQHYELEVEQTENIKRALALTEDIRKKCPISTVKKHLFIYEGPEVNSLPFNVMTMHRFNLDLKNAAKACGLRHFSSGSLRDTYMSAVNLYMIENRIPDYKKPILTHHANKKSILNYAIFGIQDILERSPKYSIGKLLNK